MVLVATKTVDMLKPGEKAYIRAGDLLLSELHVWLLHPKTPIKGEPLSSLCVEVVRVSVAYIVRLHGEGAWVYQPRYLVNPDLPLEGWIRPDFEGCRLVP